MKNSIQIKDLSDVVGKIPKMKREEVRPQIERLQKFVGSTEDLFIDRRTKTWAANGPARLTIATRVEAAKYLVSYRNSDTPLKCTATETAKLTGLSVKTLATNISKSNGQFSMTDTEDGDIITIKKL